MLKEKYLCIDLSFSRNAVLFQFFDFDYLAVRPEYLSSFIKIYFFIVFEPSFDVLCLYYLKRHRAQYVRDF